MSPLPDPVQYAVPVFIALIFAEMLVARAREGRRYCPRDTLNSLILGLGSTIVATLSLSVVYGTANWLYGFRLTTLPYRWWTWIACFVLDDLAYYAFHRSAHRVRWFWASHVNHHSSQHYNLSTALRQTWTGLVTGSFLFSMPLVLIGFPPPMLFFCSGINLIYQFWIHTEVIDRCPRWIELVMNTPSHHRVHHATNPEYLDRNYAGVFIVWDRIFGSFAEERPGERLHYGLVHQLPTMNLIWTVVHEWVGIARDLWVAPPGTRLRYLFGPPGWSHDGSRETTDIIRGRLQEHVDRRDAPSRNATPVQSAN